MQPVLAIICGSVVGFSLGLIGGGGSILAVPLLVYVVGVYDPHVAIGTSAQAVGINAFVNLIGHWRRGNVKWPCAAADAGAGVTGAAAGSTVGKAFDGARSSLQSLTAIPVKKLRVDSGLIGGTSGGTHPARLFDATIAAARALDIPVCATRVDSPDLLIAAERRGCVSAQGIAQLAVMDEIDHGGELAVFIRDHVVYHRFDGSEPRQCEIKPHDLCNAP